MGIRIEAPPPPTSTEQSGGGGGSGWVPLAKARDAIDAQLLQGRLQEAGIDTREVKDRSAPAWLFGAAHPWSPVIVLVRRFQLDEARLLLAEIFFDAPSAPEDRDPSAGARAWVGWWALALLLGTVGWVIVSMQMR